MKIIGLDNIEYEWKPTLNHSERENSSALHVRARDLLKRLYPFYSINEEVLLVGTLKERLYIDLYVHALRLAIEVQGSQHIEFNSFFFSSKKDFLKAQSRDRSKVEWCKINNIDLVTLPHDESDREWELRIRERRLC